MAATGWSVESCPEKISILKFPGLELWRPAFFWAGFCTFWKYTGEMLLYLFFCHAQKITIHRARRSLGRCEVLPAPGGQLLKIKLWRNQRHAKSH